MDRDRQDGAGEHLGTEGPGGQPFFFATLWALPHFPCPPGKAPPRKPRATPAQTPRSLSSAISAVPRREKAARPP